MAEGRLIRVFPRKTKATPDDELVRFAPPELFDEADEVHVSVTWTWDIPKAERLARAWQAVTSKVFIGGPAMGDPGGEFEPGKYVRKGYLFTSRGCPNACWFCVVPKREGIIRELEIKEGWNIMDSNLLACSDRHIGAVFDMLERQTEQARLTGGLEAKRIKPWIAERIARLKPKTAFFAYDTADDWEPLVSAAAMLREVGALPSPKRRYRCYVLMGWERDTMEAAEKRLKAVAGLGIMPMAMLFDKGAHRKHDAREWIHFQKLWANPYIVGARMTNEAAHAQA